MTDPTTPNREPGWYPDPWGAAELRYFDGVAWTQHAHSAASAPAVTSAPADARTPRVLLYPRTVGIGRAGMLLAAIYAVANIGTLIVFGAKITPYYHQVLNLKPGENPPALPASTALLAMLTLPVLCIGTAALTLLIVWAFRSAKNGAALGIPSAFAPGWAIGGWFIPFAWYVLPCLSIVGSAPRALRRHVVRWWVATALSVAAATPVGFAMNLGFASNSTTPITVVGAIAIVFSLVAASLQVKWGYELTAAMHEAHAELAGQPNT